MLKILKGLSQTIHRFSYKNYKIVILISLIVLISGSFLLKNLKIEPTLLDAEGLSGKEFQYFLENYKRFGESTPLVLLQQHSQVDENVKNQFTDVLAEKLRSMEEMIHVQSSLFDLSDTERLLQMCRAVIFQDPGKYLPLFTEKFTEQGINKEIARSRKKLVMADLPEYRKVIAVDIFNLRELLEPWLKVYMANYKISPDSVYFDSEDLSCRLIFAQPRGSGEDTQYCIQLTKKIKSIIIQVKASIPGSQSITCSFAGKYGLTAETYTSINKEIFLINMISAVLIFSLLIMVFRNFKVTLLCFLPIFFSVYVSILAAYLFFNPLKMISIGFAAIVLGLGVDITFHLSSRYFQYHKKKKSLEEAVQNTVKDCGPPLIIGISTTALGFFVLSFSRYSALRQFGMLTCVGLLLTLTVTLLLFPALVGWLKPQSTTRIKLAQLGSIPRLLYNISLKKPVFSRITTAGILIISIIVMTNLKFDMSLFNLLPRNLTSLKNAEQVSEKFGSSFLLSTQITLKTDDLNNGMQYQRLLDKQLFEYVQNEEITGFYSPTLFYIPENQIRNHLNQVKALYAQIKEKRPYFFKRLDQSGFHILSNHDEYYDLLENIFDEQSLFSKSQQSPLSQFIKKEGEYYFLQTYIWPKNEITEPDFILSVTVNLKKIPSPTHIEKQITGTYQVHQSVNKIVKREFISISLWAAGIISLILFLYLRNFRLLFFSLLSLFCAIPLTLAFVTFTSIMFSPALIGVVAMIIGIGIDDSVHLIHRKISTPGKNITDILTEIAPVLTLTTASTMICFLILMLSSSPIVSNTGIIVGFGVFACWLFTMFLLPSFLDRTNI
ncbi:MAG: MMPL family transporter [Candidatus Aminicenantes bacterium]|nr:MMPL family transporter [Candidatus Aminicenantes bacterium]